VEWVAAAIGSELSVRALDQADCVFHLVSSTLPSTSNCDILYDLESNVLTTVRILEAAAAMRIRRIVFVFLRRDSLWNDSPKVDFRGPSNGPYLFLRHQKLAIEKYLQLFSLNTQSRLDCTPGLEPVWRVSGLQQAFRRDCTLHKSSVRGIPIEIWGDGTTTRDYVHVDDVANALLRCISYEGAERQFNIGSGRGVTLNELVEMLQQWFAEPVKVNYRPRRGFDVPENVLDISRARRELSWRPEVLLDLGLERMIQAARTAVGDLEDIDVEVVNGILPSSSGELN